MIRSHSPHLFDHPYSIWWSVISLISVYFSPTSCYPHYHQLQQQKHRYHFHHVLWLSLLLLLSSSCLCTRLRLPDGRCSKRYCSQDGDQLKIAVVLGVQTVTYEIHYILLHHICPVVPLLEFRLLLLVCRHGVIITSSSEMIHHWNFARCGHESPAWQYGVSSVAMTRNTKGNNVTLEMSWSCVELYVYFMRACWLILGSFML